MTSRRLLQLLHEKGSTNGAAVRRQAQKLEGAVMFAMSKLPIRKWIKLSEVVNFLAFGEAVDNDTMHQEGTPSDRKHTSELRKFLRLCREETVANLLIESGRDDAKKAKEGTPVATPSPFLECIGPERRGQIVVVPHSTDLEAIKDFWPPSGQKFCDMIRQWEVAQAEEDRRTLTAAASVSRGLVDGGLVLNGERNGRRENIEASHFSGSPSINWRIDILEVNSHPWGVDNGESLTWTGVCVDRESLAKYLSETKTVPLKQNLPNRPPGKRPQYDWEAIEKIARHCSKNLQRDGGYDSKPGATERTLIKAIQEGIRRSNGKSPGRSSIQAKLRKWGL